MAKVVIEQRRARACWKQGSRFRPRTTGYNRLVRENIEEKDKASYAISEADSFTNNALPLEANDPPTERGLDRLRVVRRIPCQLGEHHGAECSG